jgi:hypothetical protein
MTSQHPLKYVCSGRPGRQSRERYVVLESLGTQIYFVLRRGNSRPQCNLPFAQTLKNRHKICICPKQEDYAKCFSFLASFFFPIGDPKKNPILFIQWTFVKNNGQKLLHLELLLLFLKSPYLDNRFLQVANV